MTLMPLMPPSPNLCKRWDYRWTGRRQDDLMLYNNRNNNEPNIERTDQRMLHKVFLYTFYNFSNQLRMHAYELANCV
jgi:hypothetical protein